MGEKIVITTPEQVELEYELAGLGSRCMAALIDTLIQGVLVLCLYVFAIIVGIANSLEASWISSLALAFTILLIFLVIWGYFVYFETQWSGQTPGKRRMGLRVLRDSGHPVDFRTVFLRNVMRVVDYPFALGVVVMFVDSQSRRLGDYAAGTIVIKERVVDALPDAASVHPALWESQGYTFLNDQALSRISSLSRQDYETARRFLERSPSLEWSASEQLARQIALPLMARLGVSFPHLTRNYERFLLEVARAYENSSGQK